MFVKNWQAILLVARVQFHSLSPFPFYKYVFVAKKQLYILV